MLIILVGLIDALSVSHPAVSGNWLETEGRQLMKLSRSVTQHACIKSTAEENKRSDTRQRLKSACRILWCLLSYRKPDDRRTNHEQRALSTFKLAQKTYQLPIIRQDYVVTSYATIS